MPQIVISWGLCCPNIKFVRSNYILFELANQVTCCLESEKIYLDDGGDIVSLLGFGADIVWQRLLAGQSGLRNLVFRLF